MIKSALAEPEPLEMNIERLELLLESTGAKTLQQVLDTAIEFYESLVEFEDAGCGIYAESADYKARITGLQPRVDYEGPTGWVDPDNNTSWN